MVSGHSHRSTVKKSKKPFKSRHASKGQVKARNQGKVEKTTTGPKKKLRGANKLERKNFADQLKEKKVLQALENRKLFQSASGVQKIVTIISLTDDISEEEIFQKLIDNDIVIEDNNNSEMMVENTVQDKAPFIKNLKISKFKSNFKFIIPDTSNFLSILDASRVSDFVIFGLSASNEVDTAKGEQIIRAIELQGISNVICVVPNIDNDLKDKQQKQVLASLTSYFTHFFPGEDKIFNLNNSSSLSKCIHTLCSVIPKGVTWLNNRGYVVAENIKFDDQELVIDGTVRGKGFHVNQTINIPNVGEFKVKLIEKLNKHTGEVTDVISEEIILENESIDELSPQDGGNDDEMYMDDDDMMSDYDDDDMVADDLEKKDTAAATILDPNDDDFDPEIEDVLKGKNQVSIANDNNDIEFNEDYDHNSQLDQFMEESRNPGSTEEFYLDPKESAVERLHKYKFSIKDITDQDEQPPKELQEAYGNLLNFRSFKRSTQRNLKIFNGKTQVTIGESVRLHLVAHNLVNSNTDHITSMLNNYQSQPVVVFGLLSHEEKKSLVHFSFKTWESYEDPVTSKDDIVVQYGSRREVIKPMYSVNSNNSNGNAHKYLKFSTPGNINIASAIVPAYFGRIPVLFFKPKQGNNSSGSNILSNLDLELIGSGSLESIDNSRSIVKRRLLVGQPFKIHKKVITIRYMFFKPEDISHYESVPLFTKSGSSGWIRESLGTHGYFKTSFNRKLSAQDYVYMALYKRVWPKGSTPYIAN
ncbi:Tsr1 protein [Saccharomycopsis crataegensis]|uniref:Tsr1 protein n=1 Tax=Saccharomycopsis crataegensis TaxID=43959 RepID=A0AAV5QF69_9ASCO|nr:Tsr1 protein [Saccharomycopsis crataegensis]